MAKQNNLIPTGTLRIGSKDFKVYEKTKTSWKLSKKSFPEAQSVIELFNAQKNISVLIDKKNPRFLKGQLSPDGKIQGARINLLPSGEVLDKAYSLFSKNLTIHDEASHDHWAVIYQNPGGGFSYAYTLDKRNRSIKNKYKKVSEFKKVYPKLNDAILTALSDKQDNLAIPMYTLLKTYMRVGNETYYKAHGHKGLTTLKKSDIKINGKDVEFRFIAKSGVPMDIKEEFPKHYISRLKNMISKKKNSDFIFTDDSGKPLKDTHFMKAFEQYTGKRFYPHIVRSFYATERAQEFLKQKHSASKQEIKGLFTEIAEKLGHKKFDKKSNEWKDSYNVTVHHYLNPDIYNQVLSIQK